VHVSMNNTMDVIPDIVGEHSQLPTLATSSTEHAKGHMLMLLTFIATCLVVNLRRKSCSEGCKSTVCSTTYYFLMPACLGMQITMLVNSAVHLWGDQPYKDGMSEPCTSRNNAFLMFPMMGENWHNNHHGAPGSATTWVEWYQVDFQYMSMRTLEFLGLVSEIHVQPPSVPHEGYEQLSFLSVLCSWAMMATLVATPFALGHIKQAWAIGTDEWLAGVKARKSAGDERIGMMSDMDLKSVSRMSEMAETKPIASVSSCSEDSLEKA